MASLSSSMSKISLSISDLRKWGKIWLGTVTGKSSKQPNRFDKQQGMHFGYIFDQDVATSLAKMLGGISIKKPKMNSLMPAKSDCVELGAARIIGGIRPQDFDVAYRPDGPRIAFDSKTLNDSESVGKNWRNMVNDLATESSTVHTRFPYCLVGFIIVIPRPALSSKYEVDIVRTLERLGTRDRVLDEPHLAEAVSLVVWDPKTGTIDKNVPSSKSNIRIENFSERIYPRYLERYKGLPPHDQN